MGSPRRNPGPPQCRSREKEEEQPADRSVERPALRPAPARDAQDQAEDDPGRGELGQGHALLGELGRGRGRPQPESRMIMTMVSIEVATSRPGRTRASQSKISKGR